jgi:transcriptional regulator with PAS, ATPase and Fis domain
MESEFFGYEKGAFTGAYASRAGLFEQANGGILFLDEITEMPLSIQPKFLRVLQEKNGTRLGGSKPVKYDFRLISATNKDIFSEVNEKHFRQDLFFRLFAVDIMIPPLRQRHEDIIPLALSFLSETSQRFNKRVGGFSTEVLSVFEKYHWAGNVRQLRREVERLVALTTDGERIEISSCSRELQDIEQSNQEEFQGCGPLAEQLHQIESKIILTTLEETGGNKSEASRILGITRQGLDKKLKRHSKLQ